MLFLKARRNSKNAWCCLTTSGRQPPEPLNSETSFFTDSKDDQGIRCQHPGDCSQRDSDVISNIRLYWSDGRGADLQHYAALAYGIAVLEYAISPEHLVMWAFRYHGYPNPFFLNPLVSILWLPSIVALTIIWIVVVVMGFRKCGWPALILLISIPWGLRLLVSLDLLEASCLFAKDCL
jgi:hypothetical protein